MQELRRNAVSVIMKRNNVKSIIRLLEIYFTDLNKNTNYNQNTKNYILKNCIIQSKA